MTGGKDSQLEREGGQSIERFTSLAEALHRLASSDMRHRKGSDPDSSQRGSADASIIAPLSAVSVMVRRKLLVSVVQA